MQQARPLDAETGASRVKRVIDQDIAAVKTCCLLVVASQHIQQFNQTNANTSGRRLGQGKGFKSQGTGSKIEARPIKG